MIKLEDYLSRREIALIGKHMECLDVSADDIVKVWYDDNGYLCVSYHYGNNDRHWTYDVERGAWW